MSTDVEIFKNLEIYYNASNLLRAKFREFFDDIKNSVPPAPFTFKIEVDSKLEEDYFILNFAGLSFDVRFSVDIDLEEGLLSGLVTLYDLNNEDGDEVNSFEFSQSGIILNDDADEDRNIGKWGYVIITEFLNDYIYSSFDLEDEE